MLKYCLYEEPGPKKEDYKDRFRSCCLFSLRAASQILGGWAGRWCWVASSAGACCYFCLIVGQGPAVLAAGAGRVGNIFYIFHLSSTNVLSFGRRLT